MLVEELDLAIVDSLGNLLADLVRATALDHVQTGPAVLSVGTGRSTHEQVVLQLSLKVILLDMVGESSGHDPEGEMLGTWSFRLHFV